MSVNTNRILRGSTGNVWYNTTKIGTVKKIEAKVKGDFEEDNFCGDNANYTIYNGWTGEGTLTIQKTDSAIWSDIAAGYKSGIMPSIKIVTALTDVSTGQSERVSIEAITITEFDLVNFEAKKQVEIAFPFKFADYEIIETIQA
jgi:hypothetical protein